MYARCIEPTRLAFVGDTQRILNVERLAHPNESNDRGRALVAAAILAEPVDALIHLGDVVGCASDWDRFDRDYPPAVLAGKPLYVCRGNHDRDGFWFGSAKEFERRFPLTVARQQTIALGCVRLVLLDSNLDVMTEAQWERQLDEYRVALHAAEQDDSVTHVVVACHHPPFTNARWHPPSRTVRDAFVPPFLAGAKSRLFLSGHAHGYERFRVSGKTFVVSGGGGGARFSHQSGRQCRQTAEIDLADPHPFHYCLVQATNDSFSCTVRSVDESSGQWSLLERF